jgi:hypothetical protein
VNNCASPKAANRIPLPHEFNTLMVDFYRLRDATGMIAFLTDCHPDATRRVV